MKEEEAAIRDLQAVEKNWREGKRKKQNSVEKIIVQIKIVAKKKKIGKTRLDVIHLTGDL